jgi:hypothetical protein
MTEHEDDPPEQDQDTSKEDVIEDLPEGPDVKEYRDTGGELRRQLQERSHRKENGD